MNGKNATFVGFLLLLFVCFLLLALDKVADDLKFFISFSFDSTFGAAPTQKPTDFASDYFATEFKI